MPLKSPTTRKTKTMKNDWFTIIITFQLGFCINASLWHFEQGRTEDIGYPLGISIAAAVALICRILVNRSRHNTLLDQP